MKNSSYTVRDESYKVSWNGISDNKISDRSNLLIEQLKEKLNQCERKAVESINELNIALSQQDLKNRADNEIALWQEKYKARHELKDENFKDKVLDKLVKWNI